MFWGWFGNWYVGFDLYLLYGGYVYLGSGFGWIHCTATVISVNFFVPLDRPITFMVFLGGPEVQGWLIVLFIGA